jgi:uncharacterized membrane protein
MDKKIKIWIKAMYLFDKYWGCHQLPERSFFLKGYQFPICARCTGIIIGELISFVLFLLNYKIEVILCIILLIPLILDGTIQYFTRYISNNIKRFLTGLIFGIGFIQLILYIIYSLIIFVYNII